MTTAVPEAAPNLAGWRAACWATRAQFLTLGFATGAWGVHVPSAKAHYALSDGALSLALLAVAVGAVACLLFAGRVVHRLGARRCAMLGGLLMAAVLAGVVTAALGPAGLAALIPLMLIFGAGTALFDVAINTEGSLLEERGGKKVMSGFHGMFSLGGMAGAGVGALLLSAQVAPAAQLLWAALAVVGATLLAGAFMLPVHPAVAQEGWVAPHPRGALWVLGLLAGAGLLSEGAIYDWSVLYMTQDLGSPQAFAALAYASFSAAMAATRFAGDWLRTHLRPSHLLTGSALVSAVAMAAVLLLRDPLWALIGFAFVGAGLANVVPVLFLAASRMPGIAPASGIATVSSLGYLGFVAGPPLVGGIAQLSSLSWSLSVVVLASVLLAWGARRLPH